jgi:uncharacterized protein
VYIEVEELESEPLHVQHVYALDALGFKHDQAALNAPVSTDFVLAHEDRDLQVGGTVCTSIRYTCSRCLKEYIRPLSAQFELSYAPHPGVSGGEEIELKYEDMHVGFYDGIGLDVDQMIVEQIELALPMKIICGEDCLGLCPGCGVDLNETPCRCPRGQGDSRLAVLLEFRKKMGPTE